jgi:hypothetical protein
LGQDIKRQHGRNYGIRLQRIPRGCDSHVFH